MDDRSRKARLDYLKSQDADNLSQLRSEAARIGAPDFRSLLRARFEERRAEKRAMGYRGLLFPNGIRLSIQAGEYHYCRPREFGYTVFEYEAWEVAVIAPGNGDWIKLTEDDWGGDSVAAYVPTARVQAIFDLLFIEHGGPVDVTKY